MLTFKKLTIKNFMSIGAQTQTIHLDNDDLTLILGENLDKNENGSRNGAGKTTILNAISYALYGQALTNIKKDNLINKTNQKNMYVTLEFEKGPNKYKVERFRRPHGIKWVVNDGIVNAPDTDESEGDSRWTQKEIERVVGMSHDLFKHLVALNTYTEPFLAMRSTNQRFIIEELLGITLLSQKADKLKEMIKLTKDLIKEEDLKIKAKRESNASIQRTIDDLKRKSTIWISSTNKKIKETEDQLAELGSLDVDTEIENHSILELYNQSLEKTKKAKREQTKLQSRLSRVEKEFVKLNEDLTLTNAHSCPTCGQDIHDEKHGELLSRINEQIKVKETEYVELTNELEKIQNEINSNNEITSSITEACGGDVPKTFYSTLEEVYNHKSTLDQLNSRLDELKKSEDPYEEQVKSLTETGIQEIDFSNVNELTRIKDHQEFLFKILTSKDSFIRKKIIDQNLAFLNSRLSHYCESLGLPHQVKFLNDLSVEITELGRDFDFDNLSRGERNRLILSMSWSFRDIYETLNQSMNILFIDELLDSGMDSRGVEDGLSILKKISRERNKNIFLISHREELLSRVNNVLMVQKEGGFTSFQHHDEV